MDYRKVLDAQWDKRGIKLDWLELENVLVAILSDDIAPEAKVEWCKEALNAYTRRGHFA